MIRGHIDPAFSAVEEAFAANFAERGETGAAVAVYVDGRPVADLWAGERAPGHEWEQDTVVLVWSATKGITALTLQRLVDTGRLALDEPVVTWWPEFGTGGKDEITLSDVLTHGARLPYPPGYETIATADGPAGWDRVDALTDLLEVAEPVLPPGVHGYHALTFGLLLNRIVSRATGRSIGQIFAEEIAGPLSLDAAWIGRPAAGEDRIAELELTIPPPPTDDPDMLAAMAWAMSAEGPIGRSLLVGPSGAMNFPDIGNDPSFRRVEHPAANGVVSARALARMYAMLAAGGSLDGVSVVSPSSVADHSAERWRGEDATLLSEKRYALGYMLPGTPTERYGPAEKAFGHPGMGGSLGFADPDAKVGFAYVTRHMVFEVAVDPRVDAVADAVYDSL